jgi:hypothetical protein
MMSAPHDDHAHYPDIHDQSRYGQDPIRTSPSGYHKHRCVFCADIDGGYVWEHHNINDICHGSEGAHECPRCGRCNWSLGIYTGTAPAMSRNGQEPVGMTLTSIHPDQLKNSENGCQLTDQELAGLVGGLQISLISLNFNASVFRPGYRGYPAGYRGYPGGYRGPLRRSPYRLGLVSRSSRRF